MISSCSSDDEDNVRDEQDVIAKLRQDEIPDFNFPTPCEAARLTFFIDENCIGTVYQAAIQAAIQEYNEAPIAVAFREIDVETEADIVFSCVNGDNCGEGVTFFDDEANRNPTEANIELEILWENCLCTDPSEVGCNLVGFEPACMFTRTVMHEIGHAIGIHHNGEGNHIDGTPITSNDPNSIYNSGPVTNTNCDWCDAPCVFNNNDLTALQILYPVDYSCYHSPKIFGPTNLCMDELGSYCIPEIPGMTVSWFGHPEINGSTDRCVTLSYQAEGSDFIYADVQIKDYEYLGITKKINIGSPNIIEDLVVIIDPCLDIINIDGGNPDFTYSWNSFSFSYNASPHIGTTNNRVRVRAPLIAGEEFCFRVEVSNDCGTSFLPCEVCYSIPECRGNGKVRPTKPNNACNWQNKCPVGYTCKDGICCEDITEPCEKTCSSGFGCGIGYDCIDGCCVAVGGNPCNNDSKCPPGFHCIDGICQTPY